MARDVKKDGSGGEGERKSAEEEDDVKEIKGDAVFLNGHVGRGMQMVGKKNENEGGIWQLTVSGKVCCTLPLRRRSLTALSCHITSPSAHCDR